VLSYTVARRTQEIGVRMALGAEPHDVIAMILKEIGLLICLGLALGIPIALGLSRVVAGMLYGLTPTDPFTILAAALALVTVALFGGYVPARRAARVDPMVALRWE
jgi:ABC-type antimicrobial peptide transport system permease subunit